VQAAYTHGVPISNAVKVTESSRLARKVARLAPLICKRLNIK